MRRTIANNIKFGKQEASKDEVIESAKIACLFDDVNELCVDGENRFIYPHQIETSIDSSHKVVVKKSFFKGSFWLIEATYNSQAIFFKNAENIIPGKEINICFKN